MIMSSLVFTRDVFDSRSYFAFIIIITMMLQKVEINCKIS